MQNILVIDISLLTISCLISFLFIPKVISLGEKWNTKDYPDFRKNQKKPLIRIGGLGIIFAIVLSAILIILFAFTQDILISSKFIILIFAIVCAFLIGFIDDVFSLSPYLRLVIQILLSIFCWSMGIQIKEIYFPFLSMDVSLPDLISLLITILWISGCINALNWIDGLDGLAGGYGFIANLGLVFLGIIYSNYDLSLLAAIISGGLLGFLPYNLKQDYKKKIIMGDGGSYIVGCGLALLTIQIPYNQNTSLNIVYPIIFLAHPLIDMVSVIFRRIMNKKSPFRPDREHFHHRLKDLGLSTFTINKYFLTTTLLLISVILSFNGIAIQPLWFICSIALSLFIIKFMRV